MRLGPVNARSAVASWLLPVLLAPLRLLPVKRNRVVFLGVAGGSASEYSCNPRAVYEQLADDPDLDIAWLMVDPEAHLQLREAGVQLARHGSLRAMLLLATAGIVVTNGGYVNWFPFRRNQYVINTWHGGGAYKRLPFDRQDAGRRERRKQYLGAGNTSLFVSSSHSFTDLVVRGSLLYPGPVLEVGMPRNDVLLDPARRTLLADRARAQLGIAPGTSTVLVAPTFRRDDDEAPLEPLDAQGLAEALTQRFGGDWLVLWRDHRLALAAPDRPGLDVSDYPDMQDLLCLADVLVTDYSSAVWDYSLIGRPCFLYVPDLADFTASNGFYVDLPDWGFPFATGNAELASHILGFDEQRYRLGVARHHDTLGSVESGRAAEAVAGVIQLHTRHGQPKGQCSECRDRVRWGIRPTHEQRREAEAVS